MARGRAIALVAVFGLLPTGARAQLPPIEPSPLTDADVTQVTRDELDAALPARAACREMVDVLNEAGLRWGRVRSGDLGLKAFARQVESADYNWGQARGACGHARSDLADDLLTRRVLDHEARRLDRLQEAMGFVEQAWIAEAETDVVNQKLRTYREKAEAYAAWATTAAEFWQGGWLRDSRAKGCIDDVDAEVRETASALRGHLVRPPGERDDGALVTLGTKLESIESVRAACAVTTDAERMELEILGRLLGVYRDVLLGLAGGDDERVREALEAEQDATARRARCAEEHAAGDPSTLCRPGSKVGDAGEPR